MQVNPEQREAVKCGEVVQITVNGQKCALLSWETYERLAHDKDYDVSEWTEEEMDLLAAETADMLAGDGLDEPHDA